MAKSQGNHKDSANSSMRVRFGPFVFDRATRQLLEGTREVHLSPKSFDVLQLLIEHRPALNTREVPTDPLTINLPPAGFRVLTETRRFTAWGACPAA